MLKMEEEGSSEVLEVVKQVLEEFKDIVPDDLLEGLLPLRDI